MKMNINEDNISDTQAASPLSNDERQFFRLLSEIPGFDQLIKQSRQSCNIHSEGISKMWPITKKKLRDIDFVRLFKISITLTEELKLAPEWRFTTLTLLLGLPLEKEKFSQEPIKVEKIKNQVVIKIQSKISRKKLATFIQKNDPLKKILAELPQRKIIVKKKNIDRDLAILKLKLDGKKRSEIAEKIMDIDDRWAVGDEDVPKYAARMALYLNRLFNKKFDYLSLVVGATTIEQVLQDS
jgi:hypothetical protein